MPAAKKNTKAATKVEEVVEDNVEIEDADVLTAEQERDARAARDEALEGMPELRPAVRFRLGHKNAFEALRIYALKSGAFEALRAIRSGEKIATVIEQADAILALRDFLVKVDEFAESIAVNPAEYVEWSEQLEDPEQVFMALFSKYTEDLGE